MSILITDSDFRSVSRSGVEIEPNADPEEIDLSHDHISILFPNYADGRGFGIAAALRRRGYQGTLCAKGHVLADQYTMARRVGFNEVEISEELASRQGKDQWRARLNWREYDYQSRLGQRR